MSLRSLGTTLEAQATPYFAPQDRPSYIRYFSARKRYPKITKQLTRIVMDRPDSELCEFLCNKISLGSYLEALYLLLLQAKGARPCLVRPHLLGHTPNPIINPETRQHVGHLPNAALEHLGVVYFFQVSFSTPSTNTVDVLAWNGRWRVIELNGEGHDGTYDWTRQHSLGIPVSPLTLDDVLKDAEFFLENRKLGRAG